MNTDRKYWLDLGERVGWTCAEAALGVVTAEVLGLSGTWAVLFATATAGVKGYVARRIGNPNSASTISSV